VGRPTVTAAQLRREADARLVSDVQGYGFLTAAANTIEQLEQRLAEKENR